MKKFSKVCMVLFVVLVVASPAYAAVKLIEKDLDPAKADPNAMAKAETGKYVALAMGFGLAIAAFGGALGQGKAIAAAVESIARQPEKAGDIRGALIIGLALIETLVIYVLLICFFLNGSLPIFGG
ncbi:MAG: F-type H+-transporting ATPase subunit [Planctomycetota bacterium]|nr:MAG: F-type H+-transporting ATPase subunit [Planctomycetota bacterium]